MQMPREVLWRVSPWEIRVMRDAASGLTYAEIALLRGRSIRSVERTFERLRDKLRPWGGGSKAGLVHWVDMHLDDWLKVNGLGDQVDTASGG